ncbi:MAG: Vitamin B12 dependent methionine synthase activation subunit [Lachnospiraceae bacterium]|nr:Vitamin B12 dependent methionine synthase activation subunit [Lachnospiraceae bacterium]
MDRIQNDIRNRVNIREINRYLGYGAKTPDDSIGVIITEVLEELTCAVKPRNLYRLYDNRVVGNQVILESSDKTIIFESQNLADNLSQCEKVVLMAATLGLEADKLLQKYEVLNMTKAAIAQACGAACIEAYCNILQEQICEAQSEYGRKLYLRPRFSPGYGDLPLQYQCTIFQTLECAKRIGLTLTDSLLMYPTKSVTAFIGLTANPQSCHIGKCAQCGNTECEFRELS